MLPGCCLVPSRYSINGYFGSDPYKWGNVLCGKPLGHSAHPTHPRPTDPPCEEERAAGEWFEIYPPPDNDICHKGPVTSIRWELLRQGLEDVEYVLYLVPAYKFPLPAACSLLPAAPCTLLPALTNLSSTTTRMIWVRCPDSSL